MNLIKKILLIKICESLLLGNAFAAGPLITDIKMIKPDVRSEIVNTSPAFTGLASSVTAVTSGLVTETAARTAADALLLPLAGGTITGALHVSTNAVIDGLINAGGVNVSDGGAYTLGGVSVIVSSTVLQSYYLGGAGTSGALGMQNTATGWGALAVNTGDQNTAYGWNALGKNTTGGTNTAIGPSSLAANTIGTDNTALGIQSLLSNTSGIQNTALGSYSLVSNTYGSGNTAGGEQALNLNSTGNSNTAYGQAALTSSTNGNYNTAVGAYSLMYSTSSSYNTAIGAETGGGITYGSGNTIIGANVNGLAPGLSNNIILADGRGIQRINVDATGQVGIGTATPDYKLDVVGWIHASSNAVIDGALTAASATLGFVQVSSACATATTCIATCPGSAHGMGGSCSGATTAPESALGANSFTCTAGVAEDLNAVVACVNIN
jgi:hypothetical protein